MSPGGEPKGKTGSEGVRFAETHRAGPGKRTPPGRPREAAHRRSAPSVCAGRASTNCLPAGVPSRSAPWNRHRREGATVRLVLAPAFGRSPGRDVQSGTGPRERGAAPGSSFRSEPLGRVSSRRIDLVRPTPIVRRGARAGPRGRAERPIPPRGVASSLRVASGASRPGADRWPGRDSKPSTSVPCHLSPTSETHRPPPVLHPARRPGPPA